MVKFRYKIKKEEKKINILGELFVKNNRDKLKLIHNNKIYDLKEDFEIGDLNKDIFLDIELKGLNNIDNLSYMFYSCISLIDICLMDALLFNIYLIYQNGIQLK